MSQYKSLINFEKGKHLALARDRMMLSREQMAQKLSIDPVYLAQLEEGRREIDDWYLGRAEEMAREFDRFYH